MIDIHCHILPAIDDGPKTIDESLRMCKMAASDGIETIVATPHINKDTYKTDSKDVLKKVKELNSLLKKEKINLKVLCGNDVHIQPNLLEDIKSNKVLTVNNRKKYIILELPSESVPFYVEEVVGQLKKSRIVPIISHPERNFQIQRNTKIVEKLIKKGALIQITAMSVTGGFGSSAQTSAFNLLKKGLVDIMATDAHSVDKRPPILSAAVAQASEAIDKEGVMDMVYKTPLKIVEA
ncbi:MAG: CpsB/CapC family capsule biosynthesis tyrosine phosphatase [Candidatus Gygaella obscura]|nr:CpsB/CapC family capsule biosynthesis tyrosine phosphatase [Candidatus Gygaella obscura]